MEINLLNVNSTSMYNENIHDVLYIGLFVIFGISISLLSNFIYSKIKCLKNILPFTVNLLIIGTALGFSYKYEFFGKEDQWNSPLGDSIYNWIYLDPHILLHLFIPPLIFESASTIDHHIFMHSFSQSFILAVPGVIINIFLICFFINFLETSWSFFTCLTFGSILAATDPVAVVSLLKDIGAPKQLATLIEGESLLNDGIAFVFFTIFNNITKGLIKFNILDFCYQLLYTSIIGSLIGYFLGLFSLYFISHFYNDSITVISTSIVGCWACFYISESIHVSGVLSLVNFGLQFSKLLKTSVSLEVQEHMHNVWEILGYFANTIVFIYSGVIISNFVKFNDYNIWLNLLYLYLALQIIRSFTIAILYKCLKNDGYGLNFREFVVLSWSGLRGAVGLIIGLIIVHENDNIISDKIMFYITGIVFLTMIVNATTTKYLVECLKLNLSSASSEKMYNNIVNNLQKFIKVEFQNCKNSKNYIGTDFEKVFEKLPTNIPKFSIKDINLSKQIEQINHSEILDNNNFLLTELRRKYLTFMRINTIKEYGKKTHGKSSVFQLIEHSLDIVEDYIYNPEINNLNLHFQKIINRYCNYDNIIDSMNYFNCLPNFISKVIKFWFLHRKITFAFDLSSKYIEIINKSNESFENFINNEISINNNINLLVEMKNNVLNDISELSEFFNDFNSTLSSLSILKNIKNQYVLDNIITKSHHFITLKYESGEINQKEYNKIKEHLKYYNFNSCFEGIELIKNIYNIPLLESLDNNILLEFENNIIENMHQPGDVIFDERSEGYICIISQGQVTQIKSKVTQQHISAKKIQKFVRQKLNFVKNFNFNRKFIRNFSTNIDNNNYDKNILSDNDIIFENCLHISNTLCVTYKINKEFIINLSHKDEKIRNIFNCIF